jgi:hypothetical protein
VTTQATKTERKSVYPRIEQSGGFFCPYVKHEADWPSYTIELIGRYRNRARAERAVRRATFQRYGHAAAGGPV